MNKPTFVCCAVLLIAVAAAAASSSSWTYGPHVGNNLANQSATGKLDESNGGWKACDATVPQWSGYYDIDSSTNKHYWYWAFGPRSNRSDAPVILWMTGGPGCSSSLAIFVENGPCHMNETTSELYMNPYSWNEDAYVVYIDQPAGVGYSYADMSGYDSDEAEVAEDMYHFLQDLFKAHSGWQSNEFFIFGESYGGHFAPATAHRVWMGNKNASSNGDLTLPLKGLAVGNGLVDPAIQYQYYADLAYNWCKEKIGQPCVSESTYQSMVSAIPTCVALIDGCDKGNSFDCDLAKMSCDGSEMTPYTETGRNVYDIREMCEHPPLCYDFSAVSTFLNRADVQKALNARTTQWQSCNFGVNEGFAAGDWFMNLAPYVADLVDGGVRTMIYAGDVDFICNWIGNKHWTLNMTWSGHDAFNKASDIPWSVDGKEVANVRSVSSAASPIHFSFVQVFNAGHMVPMNQPKAALAMVKTFLANKKFE